MVFFLVMIRPFRGSGLEKDWEGGVGIHSRVAPEVNAKGVTARL